MAERETDQARTESSEDRDETSGGAEGEANGRPDERAQQQGDQAEQQQDEQQRDERDGDGDGDGDKSEKEQRAEQHAEERKKREKKEEEGDDRPGFSLKRLHWAELVGFLGSLVLAGSLFLKWFATDCITEAAADVGRECNPNSVYNGVRGEFTAFETFKYLDWMLVAACVAPFILAYIIARGHKLSWKPGEVTMIVGMIALALILLNGIILGKPGDTVDMHFEIGWLVGLIGALLIMMGGILRQALADTVRKPPGVM